MDTISGYPYHIRPLSHEDGGGYLISFPDFDSCISDGETVQEAIRNGQDALDATLITLRELNLPIPVPYSRKGKHTAG
ncbi:type II toxin-antitoxin system HicB family antitoxin [Oxalobacteraceae bacterium A2-2]